MTDTTVGVTEGSGLNYGVDDISGTKYPYFKASFGGSNTFTHVSTSDPMPVQDYPNTTGGCTSIRLSDIDETEETVKGSAGQLYGFEAYNADASNDAFLHFYDATAPDTSSDTPKLSFLIEAGTSKQVTFEKGIPFATAITVGSLTTWAPGATGPDANEINGTFWYS